MTMKYIIFLFFLLPGINSFSADFRQTDWGMSIEQVKKTEKGEILKESTDKITYVETVVNYPALLVFKFNENRLIWGSYGFKQINDTDEEYLEDFINFNTVISNKYGKGEVLDRWTNKDSEYKDDPAMAVKEGDLVMWRSWETPTTVIKLIIYGYGGKFNLDTYYFSKRYSDKVSGVYADILNDKF